MAPKIQATSDDTEGSQAHAAFESLVKKTEGQIGRVGKSLASRLKLTRGVARQEVTLAQIDTLANGRLPEYCREKEKAEFSKRWSEFQTDLETASKPTPAAARIRNYPHRLYESSF